MHAKSGDRGRRKGNHAMSIMLFDVPVESMEARGEGQTEALYQLPPEDNRSARIDLAAPTREDREQVGLWRSWERASMAWKRSPVRSRSGPPINPTTYETSALPL